MSDFVRVIDKRDADDICHEELIRTSDLIKVVKWYGDEGSAICFEFFDPITEHRRQWIYDCGNKYRRDKLFDQYAEKLER